MRVFQICSSSKSILLVRGCHKSSAVRVRFAPSPTGYMHLGGLRTAFYNYLFARAHKGTFILRIEDTDRSRFVQGAAENIANDLQWCGIEIDEGPNIGGPFEPYYQSKRIDLYRTEIKKLLENGSAYYCFCTGTRMDILRKDALRSRQVPRYDNKCRHLTPRQIAQKLAKNMPFCIRFKLADYDTPVNDIIYGELKYNVADNEGDPIIIKSDGFPTYHLANVVDDHFMKITHVLRGVEWQISTVKHLLMYRAFGWEPPKYGHLPLLVNADGTKLSKRQNDIQISSYRDQGIFPLALINYITQGGGGFVREQTTKPTLHTVEELTQMFDISRINVNPSKLNPDLLRDFNRLELHRRLLDETHCTRLVEDLIVLVKQKFMKERDSLDLNPEHVRKVLKWSSTRVSSIRDLVDIDLSFLWILPKDNIKTNLHKDTIFSLISILESSTFNEDDLKNLLKKFAKDNDIKFPELMKTLRASLSGLDEGPGVAEMMEILGKQTTLQRIGNLYSNYS